MRRIRFIFNMSIAASSWVLFAGCEEPTAAPAKSSRSKSEDAPTIESSRTKAGREYLSRLQEDYRDPNIGRSGSKATETAREAFEEYANSQDRKNFRTYRLNLTLRKSEVQKLRSEISIQKRLAAPSADGAREIRPRVIPSSYEGTSLPELESRLAEQEQQFEYLLSTTWEALETMGD